LRKSLSSDCRSRFLYGTGKGRSVLGKAIDQQKLRTGLVVTMPVADQKQSDKIE